MMADEFVDLGYQEEIVEAMEVVEHEIDVPNPDTELGPNLDPKQDHCIVCNKDSAENLSVLSRGFETLKENCTVIGRTDILEYLQLHPDSEHKIHGSCRRRLAYDSRKADRSETLASTSSKKRQTRSMTGGFTFADMCFLCGQADPDSTDMRKVLSGKEFDEGIRDVIGRVRCNDDWAVEVQGRMDAISDLFAVDAIYHRLCLSRFRQNLPHTPYKVKRGRPKKVEGLIAFERLCDTLEAECDNEMFTLRELHDMMCAQVSADDADVYSPEYLKSMLQKRYGNHIYFASRSGRNDVVGFSNYCDLVLHDKFFSDKSEGEGSEAEKLVQKAAGVILADIREMECRRDHYPNANDITSDGVEFLPPLLKIFMQRLIKSFLKQASIGQAILHAARPRAGAMLPLLFAVGVDVAQCGLNELHIKLARLGFCLSVDEVRMFKHSIMQTFHDNSTVAHDQNPVMHFVADNVDHNVRTLDGLGTFHGMGIISTTGAVTGSFGNKQRIRRLDKPIKASEAQFNKCVTIKTFADCTVQGLKGFNLRTFRSLQLPITMPSITNLNLLWHVGSLPRETMNVQPNWSGFMQSVCDGRHAGPSTVEMLSIVDLNPSDEDCIYSTLLYVIDQAKSFNIQTPNITFDQPLYIKAVDIAMKGRLDIVVRLGGFHTLMSFLGSIGHLMRGSGLEEVLEQIFGPNTVEHVLSGKAYARCIRGHFLIHSALTDLLLDFLCAVCEDENSVRVVLSSESVEQLCGSISSSVLCDLVSLFQQTMNNKVYADECNPLESENLQCLSELLLKLKKSLSDESGTARLWLLYMKCVDLVKLFLIAERTCNFLLHLHALHGMLSIFAATGHMNYAKSGRLYVQQMEDLAKTHPPLYDQLLHGHHSIRRSDRYWAGLSLDLVIEQTMMRAIKSQGGLTRGRGMHETVRETWLSTMTECATVRAALSKVTGAERSTPEHVEVGTSRMRRDRKDRLAVKLYLQRYSPFRFSDRNKLVSLSSGVIVSAEHMVTCDMAEEIGYRSQHKWDNKSFGDVVFKKADQAKTMSQLTSACSVETEKVSIEPTMLFHRLILVAERNNSLRECFQHELTPYPMSLFKDGLMRKPVKADLYRGFASGLTEAQLPTVVHYVIDGGYLIHKVRWHPQMDLCDILPLFFTFVSKFGRGVHVVFDGYASGPSIKDHEHERRTGKAAHVGPEKQVDINTKNVGQQEPFLANTANKKAFIDVLMPYLHENGIEVHQAPGDADAMIVSVALDCARNTDIPVALLAEDTDILALLLYHRNPSMSDIYFVSESKKGRGGKMVGGKCMSVNSLQSKIGYSICKCILVIHAFGGCDTTSAIFGHGKGSVYSKIAKDTTLQSHCMTLQLESASKEMVCTAGISLLLALYGGKVGEMLAGLRYTSYCSTSLSHRFQPERLPPSDSAARMHVMRVHLQAIIWGSLGESGIKATDWGWRTELGRLVPIQIDGDIAPDHILKVVRCKCKSNCSSQLCSCRKHGLHCVSACSNCHGSDCSNIRSDTQEVDCSDNDSEPDVSPGHPTDTMPDFFWDVDPLIECYEEEV